jgi:GT2 family glycosyltransferase
MPAVPRSSDPSSSPARLVHEPGEGIAVVMLTMNQCDKTVRCLSSFGKVTSPPHRIILWDNGSRDGTVETVRKLFPDVLTHHSPTNLGVASGRNAGAALAIERFSPSHLLFIDNDMIVAPDFISALFAPFSTGDSALAQTSAKIKFMDDEHYLYSAGGSRVRFWLGETKPIGHGERDDGQHDRPKHCIAQGGAMLVRTDVFQQLGGFDPAFNPYGPEDLDFALRARQAGYYSLYIPQAVVFHERSQTFEDGRYTERYASNKAQKWFLFMNRHATWMQRLGFYLIGAPFLLTRTLIREGRKGNFAAVKGLISSAKHH